MKVTDIFVNRIVFHCTTWRATFDGDPGNVHCITGFRTRAKNAELQDMLDRVLWDRAGRKVIERVNTSRSSTFTGHVTKLRIRKSSHMNINTLYMSTMNAPVSEVLAEHVFSDGNIWDSGRATAAPRTFVDQSLDLRVVAGVIPRRTLKDMTAGSRGVVASFTERDILSEGQTRHHVVVACDFDGDEMEFNRMCFSFLDAMRGIFITASSFH